jgi:putative peptidoglycan lipid II flippase
MLKQVLTFSTGSALGKIFGVVREILFADFFGTTAVADAYCAAMTATLAPTHLFTSEALNAAFIPQFRKYHKNREYLSWSLFNGIGFLLFFLSQIIRYGE